MKIRFCIICLIVLCGHTIYGQIFFKPAIGLYSLGLHGDSPPSAYYTYNNGYFGKISIGKLIKDQAALELQLKYARNSFSYFKRDTLGNEFDSLKLIIKNISIPVSVHIFSTNKRFYASGGIDFTFTYKIIGKTSISEVDLTRLANEVFIMAHFGVGYVIRIGRKSSLSLELCYNQSMTNIAQNQDLTNSYFRRIRLSGTSLELGYILSLTRKQDVNEK